MAKHRKSTPTLASLSKRQWMRFVSVAGAVGLLAGAGVVSQNFYQDSSSSHTSLTSFSATDASKEVSRSGQRGAVDGTSYVTVKINGKSRTVLGTKFTDVKSVLDAGDIVLEPEDTISPSLTTKVTESTVITIERLAEGHRKGAAGRQERCDGGHEPRHPRRRQDRFLHYVRLLCQDGSYRQDHSGRHRFHLLLVVELVLVERSVQPGHHGSRVRNAVVGS